MDTFKPSIAAHMMNGFLLFGSFIIAGLNFSKILSLDTFRFLILLLLFAIAISLHGLSHLGLEKVYNLTPQRFLYN